MDTLCIEGIVGSVPQSLQVKFYGIIISILLIYFAVRSLGLFSLQYGNKKKKRRRRTRRGGLLQLAEPMNW